MDVWMCGCVGCVGGGAGNQQCVDVYICMCVDHVCMCGALLGIRGGK